ncbi:hypothetical protein niasHT_012448 [Heterodera trifolii]|uniref:Uncharacterized protein n=1 Tax=Heterodera trifolii TaxID=157864 RepID=A0ABD2L347_9BILA
MAEKLPSLVVELNEIAKQIVNPNTLVDMKFIHQLIHEVRPIYVAATKDHWLLLAKLRQILNDKKIKNDVKTLESMTAIREQVANLRTCFDTQLKKIGTYHKERMELEHQLERSQGNETLEEHDRKFVDSLRLNLEECRDYIITLLAIAEKHIDLLVMSNEEKQKKSMKEEEYMSFYN